MSENWVSDLEGVLKQKGETMLTEQLIGIVRQHLPQLDTADLNALLLHIPTSHPTVARQCYLPLPLLLGNELQKIKKTTGHVCVMRNSGIVVQQANKITCISLQPPIIHNSSQDQFKDIIGETLYNQIITYGFNGLLSQKIEQTPVRHYSLYQWVQNAIEFNNNDHQLHAKLLKQVWSFQFAQTAHTVQQIQITHPNDHEIAAVANGLTFFRAIQQKMNRDPQLYHCLMQRGQFSLSGLRIAQIRQQLSFACNYFKFIRKTFTNKHYYAIGLFLGNTDDNYMKTSDQTVSLTDISITDRFFYAKTFYRPEDFDHFKAELGEKYDNMHCLEDVVLFGARKESEVILQNYIDQTSDLEGAAIVSVYLRLFLEQGRLGLKDSKMAYYSRLIKQYQYLLINKDSGNSKIHFDQKCILLEVERKKKTMNKTFAFNCLNCGNGQCLLSVVKRIANDNKQHQLRMKGNHYFSKDARSKIIYCLDCMHVLPRCAVCLIPISVYNGYAEQIKKSIAGSHKPKQNGEKMAEAVVWCSKCFHGGHFGHILKWMERRDKKCPVYNCKCRCEL